MNKSWVDMCTRKEWTEKPMSSTQRTASMLVDKIYNQRGVNTEDPIVAAVLFLLENMES